MHHLLTTAALVAGMPATQTQTTPPPLQPAAKWNVHYGDNACNIVRAFGDGDSRVTLMLTFLPGRSNPEIRLLQSHRRFVREQSGEMAITLDSGGEPIKLLGISDAVKSGSRLIYATMNAEQFAAIGKAGTIGITYRGSEFALAIKNLKAAMDAAIGCEDTLLTEWGIDPADFRKVAVNAKPVSDPGRWLTNEDYPRDSLRAGEQGSVGIRIEISSSGEVTKCTSIQASGAPRLDELTCALVMKRAKYEPARLADGTATPAFAFFRFRWNIVM